MRAFVVDKYKKPLRLAEVPEPSVGDHDVLIEVTAASLNQLDEKVRLGEFKAFLKYRAPFTLGHDVVGTVIAVGAGVRRFAVGDEVFARAGDGRIGTFAERIALPESDVALRPRNITIEDAASLPLVALTAWQALVDIGNVQAGDMVLIHGGSGGVGSIAVQLAKHLGAQVATTVSAAHADLARELGADVVIDYRTQNFDELLHDYDLVLDGVGADNVLRSLTVLRPGGTVIGIAGPPDPSFARQLGLNPVLRLVMGALSRKARAKAASLNVNYRFLFMAANGAQLGEIAALVESGALRPIVGKVVAFDDIPDALAALGKDGSTGKTVALRAGTPASESVRTITSYAQAPAKTLRVEGQTFAYRELGPAGGVPVVFFVHLAATLDNWDPRIVDAIAATRHVITFDQLGVGASSGAVPDTIEQAADDAYAFISALGHEKIDIFSFSMGAMIAQDLVVKHPTLVRKLVLTGTGPRGGKDMDKVVGKTYYDILRATLTRSDPKEFLFFIRDAAGKKAGKAFVARLKERTRDRDEEMSLKGFRTQLKAIVSYGRSAPSDLSVITVPTLIANGDNDRMVPSVLSEDLHRRIAGSELIIYPNSGHGAIFQFHEQFAPVAATFLSA